ncbi:transglutaminase family protein [Rummeliibacillus pycnus]|uniref:transglutaminase family protein n=1 Tax=Rummeliibacillus pycnus TaxID=101070 RepID=UPI000C9CD81E|nr:transglutaminase domain-containing protein [Rummeliibacillus pycnus]
MMNSPVMKWIGLIGLYLIIFLMLVEWLVPVVTLTNTGHLGLFLLFILICLGSNIFNLNGVLSFTIKILYVLWFLMYVYMGTKIFAVDSFMKIANEFVISIHALMDGNWDGVTDSFRSILFFLLLWMTIYLIHHWLTVKHSVLYFFFTTIIFLSFLDTLTDYNAKYAMIRVMILGILLMGVLFINRLFTNSQVKWKWNHYILLLIPLIVMIIGSAAFAYLMPKKQAMVNVPKPIEKLINWQNGQSGSVGKIGYVEDDRKLGGPFEKDNTVVFEATAKKNQYWRVETKSIYTGKGWERKEGDIYVHTFGYSEEIPMSMKPGKKKNTDEATITLKKNYKFILQPYGLKTIDQPNDDKSFYIEIDSEKIRPTINEEKVLLPQYSMSYSTPQYSLKALEKTRKSDLKKIPKGYKKYLQLPSSLPKRVNKLAVEITKDEKNLYDKANAIVSYFQYNGYKYSRTDVAVPSEKQDYVDQFLFETKSGYCDNFSTSMVVMLRTLGIPARWVKGFSEGDEVLSKDSTRRYVITNNNAHSWVEAYFPGVGWMSFEPTIGFNGFDNVLDDVKDEQKEGTINPKQKENDKAKAEKKKKVEQKKKEKQAKEKVKKEEKKKQKQEEKKRNKDQTASNQVNKTMLISVIIIILLTILVFLTRRKWMPKWLLMKYRLRGKNDIPIDRMYEDLLKQLSLIGLSKGQGQTLGDFAKQVDVHFGTNHMSILTQVYEQKIYSKEATLIDNKEIKECWEYLINHLTG